MLKLYDEHDEGTAVTSSVSINKATTKINSVVRWKVKPSTDSNTHLSFMKLDTVPSGARKGRPGSIKISEWRMKDIPNRLTIGRYGKVWNWRPKNIQPARVSPNGKCVCSHLPANYDEWTWNKRNLFKPEKTKSGTPELCDYLNRKKHITQNQLCKVLTTTQNNWGDSQIDQFLDQALKY